MRCLILQNVDRNSYAIHTLKITPNLLFEYQCTSGKFIRLPNRIESKLFARIGMLYSTVLSARRIDVILFTFLCNCSEYTFQIYYPAGSRRIISGLFTPFLFSDNVRTNHILSYVAAHHDVIKIARLSALFAFSQNNPVFQIQFFFILFVTDTYTV